MITIIAIFAGWVLYRIGWAVGHNACQDEQGFAQMKEQVQFLTRRVHELEVGE